jgi:hypothetical protein
MTEMKRGFLTAFAVLAAPAVFGGANLRTNPPECDKNSEDCGCDTRLADVCKQGQTWLPQ